MSSGRNVRFPSQHPGLSSTTTTSADEKCEALLNKYFRQLDLRCYVCVCVGIGRQFSSSFLLEKKKRSSYRDSIDRFRMYHVYSDGVGWLAQFLCLCATGNFDVMADTFIT
jgi:hypothetical protein